MREVQLLIELKLAEQILGLLLHLLVVLANEIEDKIATWLVDKFLLALRFDEMLDLLLSDNLDFLDLLSHEIVVVRLRHTSLSFADIHLSQ